MAAGASLTNHDRQEAPYPQAPPEPQALAEAGLTEGEVEALVLKTLLQLGNSTGGEVAKETCLSRGLTGETLSRLRDELLVAIKSSAGVNDFIYHLTEAGAVRARQHAARCNYVGAAPVPLATYADVTARQSIQNTRLRLSQLQAVLADLTLRTETIHQIAQAIHDGRGLFLYGDPGNGKTTIAERIVSAFGQHLWIPRMISTGGDMLRLFDATCHEPAETPQLAVTKYDRRWVLIERPTVIVGGELTLEQLDARHHSAIGISEAPVQMKANGGALVIDDFGRQRVSSTEILNRLIVPLEKQFDYLNLASGRQVQVPFDLLFILSTNLEPRQLVDEAFLRRIPYKIRVGDPTEHEFRSLLERLAQEKSFAVDAGQSIICSTPTIDRRIVLCVSVTRATCCGRLRIIARCWSGRGWSTKNPSTPRQRIISQRCRSVVVGQAVPDEA